MLSKGKKEVMMEITVECNMQLKTNTAVANKVSESDVDMLEMKPSSNGDKEMNRYMKSIDAHEFVECICCRRGRNEGVHEEY